MSEGDQFLVRDTRMPGHFWADNEVLDNYGPLLGAHGFAVYMALCRVAVNGTGECRISKAAIAKKLNISKGGAFNALELIVRLGLAREISSGDPRNPATYILADVKAKSDHDYKQLRLASVHGVNAQPGSSVHMVNAEPPTSVHGVNSKVHTVNAKGHQVNAKGHQVNAAFTPCAPYKEDKTFTRLKDYKTGEIPPTPLLQRGGLTSRDRRNIAKELNRIYAKDMFCSKDDYEKAAIIAARTMLPVEAVLQVFLDAFGGKLVDKRDVEELIRRLNPDFFAASKAGKVD